MNLKEYVDYPEEKNTFETLNDQEILNITINQELENNESEEEENESIEMRQITHQETLNAVELIEQYLIQQDLSYTD
ncbi:10842_t:CDS:1, partial [Acaulospora morrowiae]